MPATVRYPKADIDRPHWHVRFGPIADIGFCYFRSLISPPGVFSSATTREARLFISEVDLFNSSLKLISSSARSLKIFLRLAAFVLLSASMR